MYSLVLMTAVAAGPDLPGGGPVSGCYGSCYGCYGSCYGCYGSCYGGPAFPLARAVIGLPFRLIGNALNAFSCYGSSCLGSSCYGSSCFGCHGSVVYGGCYGSSCLGSVAVYGGCYGSGCFGSCYGCSGGCGGVILGADVGVPQVDPVAFAGPTSTSTSAKLVETDAPATLTVNLPAGATLYVDGTVVPGDGPVRRFHTPALAVGKTFYYELKAEVTLAGKTVPEEMKVVVRAGDAREVRFEKLLAATAPAPGVLASN
jgi:uncharacterized protein (TIGR03000 family)